jgi:hypothetical protein
VPFVAVIPKVLRQFLNCCRTERERGHGSPEAVLPPFARADEDSYASAFSGEKLEHTDRKARGARTYTTCSRS